MNDSDRVAICVDCQRRHHGRVLAFVGPGWTQGQAIQFAVDGAPTADCGICGKDAPSLLAVTVPEVRSAETDLKHLTLEALETLKERGGRR